MWSLPKFTKHLLFCLAIIVTGFSYTGHATNVTEHSGVITELVIDSEVSDQFHSPYFFQKFSITTPLYDFTEFKFDSYLKNQNNRAVVDFKLNEIIFLNLKPGLMQQVEIPISTISYSLFDRIHDYFFPLSGKQFLLEISNPPGVGHYSNYEKVKKDYKRGIARINNSPCINSSFPYPGFSSGQGSKIYHGAS